MHTVDRTIDDLEEGRAMSSKSMFEGFEPNRYEAEARGLWGDEAVDTSNERIRDLSPDDAEHSRPAQHKITEGSGPRTSRPPSAARGSRTGGADGRGPPGGAKRSPDGKESRR